MSGLTVWEHALVNQDHHEDGSHQAGHPEGSASKQRGQSFGNPRAPNGWTVQLSVNGIHESFGGGHAGELMHGLKVSAKGSKLPRTWLAIAKVRLQDAPLVGGEHAVQIFGKDLPGLLAIHYSTPLMAVRSWSRALAILDLTVPIGQPVMREISS